MLIVIYIFDESYLFCYKNIKEEWDFLFTPRCWLWLTWPLNQVLLSSSQRQMIFNSTFRTSCPKTSLIIWPSWSLKTTHRPPSHRHHSVTSWTTATAQNLYDHHPQKYPWRTNIPSVNLHTLSRKVASKKITAFYTVKMTRSRAQAGALPVVVMTLTVQEIRRSQRSLTRRRAQGSQRRHSMSRDQIVRTLGTEPRKLLDKTIASNKSLIWSMEPPMRARVCTSEAMTRWIHALLVLDYVLASCQ